jgi:hypothetical protein
MPAHPFDLFLEPADAPADQAAVCLQLRFTRPACPDSATEALEVGPLARQARQEIFELCQLNLQATLTGLCSVGEDVENKRRTVDNFDSGDVFQMPLLGGRQLVVED